jgi:hypothetical protein
MVLALRGVMSPAVGCDYSDLPGLPDPARFETIEKKKQRDRKTGLKTLLVLLIFLTKEIAHIRVELLAAAISFC